MNILLVLLFIIYHPGIYRIQENIRVNIVVESSDNTIKNRILSSLRTEIRGKTKVEVSDSDPKFIINTTTAITKAENGKIISVSMSTVIAKKVITNDNRTTYEVLKNIASNIQVEKIEEKCKEMASAFDVEYFETER